MPQDTVSLSNTFSWSFDWTKRVLFPFDFNRWIILAVPAWLYMLMNTSQMPMTFSGGNGSGFPTGAQGTKEIQQGIDWVDTHIGYIVLGFIGVALLLIIINLIMNWLSAFGSTVFTLNVATAKAEVSRFWSEYSKQGNNYFIYRACLSLLFIGLFDLVLIINALLIYFHAKGGAGAGDLISAGMVQLLVSFLLLIPFSFIFKFFQLIGDDFLLPIMIWDRVNFPTAFNKLCSLVGDKMGNFIVYLVVRCLIGFVINLLVGVLATLSCCLTLGLLSLPILSAIPQMPLLVFRRSFSLIYLSQIAPDINLFKIDE